MIRGLGKSVAVAGLVVMVFLLVVTAIIRIPFLYANKLTSFLLSLVEDLGELVAWAGDTVADWGDAL